MKIFAIIVTSLLSTSVWAQNTPSPQGAEVYFINLKDGSTVKSPVLVQFGLKGMGVAPAGTAKENTGHHHILVDVENPNLEMPIPTDDNHKHFGAGQTETSLELKPGKHTLQLVLADLSHFPHKPAIISKKIHITVK